VSDQPSFTLSFDPTPSEHPPFPHGYWYAVTSDGGYDATGTTPEMALANLVDVLVKALAR
jgi:hypothetical protein